MSQHELPKLIVSQKIKVTKQAATALIINDKGVDVGKFAIAYLQAYSQLLDVYANDAAAVAAGKQTGDIYQLATGALAFVL